MSLDFTALLEWSVEGSGETNRMTIQYEILPDYNFLFDFVADMFMIKKTEGVLPACFVASDIREAFFPKTGRKSGFKALVMFQISIVRKAFATRSAFASNVF